MSESFFFVPRPNTVVGSGSVSASLPTNVVVQVQVRLYECLSWNEDGYIIIQCSIIFLNKNQASNCL